MKNKKRAEEVIWENAIWRCVKARNIMRGGIYENMQSVVILVISVTKRYIYGTVVGLPPSNPTYYYLGALATFERKDMRQRIPQTSARRKAWEHERELESRRLSRKLAREIKKGIKRDGGGVLDNHGETLVAEKPNIFQRIINWLKQ